MVRSLKTTKDPTSVQENFFVYAFFQSNGKKQTSSMWFIFYNFLLLDTLGQNAAQG